MTKGQDEGERPKTLRILGRYLRVFRVIRGSFSHNLNKPIHESHETHESTAQTREPCGVVHTHPSSYRLHPSSRSATKIRTLVVTYECESI